MKQPAIDYESITRLSPSQLLTIAAVMLSLMAFEMFAGDSNTSPPSNPPEMTITAPDKEEGTGLEGLLSLLRNEVFPLLDSSLQELSEQPYTAPEAK